MSLSFHLSMRAEVVLWLLKDSQESLVVCGNDKLWSIQVKMKIYDCSDHSQHFPFGLRISICSQRHWVLGLRNFTILYQQSSKSDGARVDYHFSLESWVKVWHQVILGCCVISKHEALVSSESDVCVECVMLRLSGSSSSWWYPGKRSNLLKTVAPLSSATRSSMVGIRGFSRLTALLASHMSAHILTWPELLETMTIGLTQGVGLSRSRWCLTFLSASTPSRHHFWHGRVFEKLDDSFTLPIPQNWISKSTLTGDWGPVSSDLTWLMILSPHKFCSSVEPTARRFPKYLWWHAGLSMCCWS